MTQSATDVTEPIGVVDRMLIRRIVARDESAVAELYDRHSRTVYSVVLRILRNQSDAEDVLQDVFVRVWTRADTYDDRLGSPAAWLARIARNRAIDRLRAARARGGGDPQIDSAEYESPANDGDPETRVRDVVAADAVRGALSALPDSQRRLIEAAFFEGYTHQELANRFQVPLGTVKTRIRTGMLTLRDRLGALS